jgi:recombination protein RecA
MGQGRENARQFLKENKDIRQEVENRLRQGLGLPVLEAVSEPQAAAAGGGKGEKGSVLPMPEKKKA